MRLLALLLIATFPVLADSDVLEGGLIREAIREVTGGPGQDFCQSDRPCQDGLQLALSQIQSQVQKQTKLPSLRMIVLLKTEEIRAKAQCGHQYAGSMRRRSCQNGAQAAVSFLATALDLNRELPPLDPQVIEGQAQVGYEKYHLCLRHCTTHPPLPPEGCEAHCKDAFDLKTFLKSLPQL